MTTAGAHRIARRMKRVVADHLSRRHLLRHTRRLLGPRKVALADDEVMLVLLARDVEFFLPTYLEHHFGLGVRHVLVIDNGSRDATVEICAHHDRVTVLQNLLPAKHHESALRSVLAQSTAAGGWLLFADADELIEPPIAAPDALRRIARYCNRHGMTVVIGQMLDRFSTRSHGELRKLCYPQSIREMRFHSLDAIEAVAYDDAEITRLFGHFTMHNRCDDPGVRLLWGGVEAEVFGTRSLRSCHSMVRNLPTLTPMAHPHFASRVNVADVTMVIHHYKLSGDWIARERVAQRGAYWEHGESDRRMSVVGPDEHAFRIAPRQPQEWVGVEQLLEPGFLHASPRFRAFMMTGN